MTRKLWSLIFSFLLLGCAIQPYWYPDSALKCDVKPRFIRVPTEQLEQICQQRRKDDDACIFIKPGVCEIYLGPAAGECQINHELKHSKGNNHDNRPIYTPDCGDE